MSSFSLKRNIEELTNALDFLEFDRVDKLLAERQSHFEVQAELTAKLKERFKKLRGHKSEVSSCD